MNIKIELLGYKGTLTHITFQLAYLPWQKDDKLLVYIEFKEPLPANIISTTISIPVRDYSREEFLKVVKEEGEKQLAVSLENYREAKEMQQKQEMRKEELDALVMSLESKF